MSISQNAGDRGSTGTHQMSQDELRGASYPAIVGSYPAELSRQEIPTVGPGPRPTDEIAQVVAPNSASNRTPGPGGPLRGVEANTNRSDGTTIPTYHSPDSDVEPAAPEIECEGDCP